ncbi:MAG TPA: hypothetical protein VHU14_06615 [Solirubrobacterales bacterium]|jgi:hypothetical protein|nr:hypothetical protein [Solirubrobacterales bacterium]
MPEPGYFVLHPAVLPPLKAGSYTLHGEVEEMAGGAVEPLDAHLTVSSPRYTMPPDQILSTFPPANGTGSFQDVLPQIVLKRRTLPWERPLAGAGAESETPWLALVVIAEGEGSLSSEAKVEDCVTAGTTLPVPEDRDTATSVYLSVTETVVKGVFPTIEDVRLLAHVREVDVGDSELMGGDDDGFLAVVAANRLPQPGFDAEGNPTVPRKYLACLVNLEQQWGRLPPVPPDTALEKRFDAVAVIQDLRGAAASRAADPDRTVMGGPAPAIAAGDRPAPDTTTRAVHAGAAWAAEPASIAAAAVSAAPEEAATVVREAMGSAWRLPIEGIVAEEPVYRFPVLAHWSFTVSGDPTFEQLLQGLDVGLLGTLRGDLPEPTDKQREREAEEAKRRTPAPARPEPELAETGHVGLPHQTRRGDHVEAWFRGPLSPHPTVRDEPVDGRLPLAHASDQLRVVVPDGREDVSLAAAFEIGRLLGLSQTAVVNALLRWRQEQFGAERAARLAAEAAKGVEPAGELPAGRDPGLGALIGRGFVLGAAKEPDAVLAPSRPLVDPGRPLAYAEGDLDRLVADGLGISLDAVQRAAKQLGEVGALAEAPVASAGDGAKPDGATDQALHADLDAAVGSLAAEALGRIRPPRPGPPIFPPLRPGVLERLTEPPKEQR